jgi:hypothetical protein
MSKDIRVNNVGIRFVVTVENGGNTEDLSIYETRQILFRKPDNTIIIREALFENDGTDGIMYVVSAPGDLDLAGVYRIQTRLANESVDYTTDIGQFRVSRNL